MAITDSYNRKIDYLRISVTDRCNMRCAYCMPLEGIKLIPHHEVLHYGEIREIVKAGALLGIKSIRLTGGEPTIRRDLSRFISMLKEVEGIEEVTLTTNALLLSKLAQEFKDAGMDRVNISLDSLKPERFSEITRGGDLKAVLEGIQAALDADLSPVKLNVVVIPGFNDDEIEDMAALSIERPLHVRYIEFMPIGDQRLHKEKKYIKTAELVERLKKKFEISVANKGAGMGPASSYRIKGAKGTIGFISSISEHFCSTCNRLRLSSDGWLRSCLFNENLAVDMKTPLRNGASLDDLKELFMKAAGIKPVGHELDTRGSLDFKRTMSQIGG
ncbi:MAG: GTP 3',8-cyclase [Deltaproteobacteria bacterium]|nr:GTP 3',8-cyclase [Deltaproteobacteria bacterium]